MSKLIIITSQINDKIVEKELKNNVTNKPFYRHKMIFNKLKTFNQNIIIINDDIEMIKKKLLEMNVIDQNYFLFLEKAYNSYHQAGHPNDYTSPFDQGLVCYHFSKNYHDRIKNFPSYLQCGYYGDDFCTSIFDYTYEIVLRSAFNGIMAAQMISSDQNINLIYCQNIFPGHHATYSSYSGYCFLNNIAICAEILLKSYDRIAILDLDFHHGDGTQKIFYQCERVMTISIHGCPTNNFPFYTGYTDENNVSNYNFPLQNYTEATKYLKILSDAIKLIEEHNSEILLIAFGGDTYQKDPEGFFSLDINDYAAIGQLIRSQFKKPIIVTQEGGYCFDAIDSIVSTFITSLM